MDTNKLNMKIMAQPTVDMSEPFKGRARIAAIPWNKISRMAAVFTRRAMDLEQASREYHTQRVPDKLSRLIEADDALTKYAIKFGHELKQHGLKIGKH